MTGPDRPEDDPIDAEFADVDEDRPLRPPHKVDPKSGGQWGGVLLLICLVGAGIYWVFGRNQTDHQAKDTLAPGWYDLLDCSYTVSLDGTKELNVFENHGAVLYDKSVKMNGKYRAIDGNWTFDEVTKLYSVTLNGETETYSLLGPEGATGICMLVKGDLGAADLRGSWFSTSDQGDAEP
jgi:hypothetical protein